MPMDGVTLGFIAREVNALIGGRIDKITQPERDELFIAVRSKGSNETLLVSASASCARAHLTQTKKVSPMEPPMFLMILRKHLSGGRIVNILQILGDRILEIHVESLNELGDLSVKRLVCEFMGKHSNIILVAQDGRIIDSMRRVTEDISRVRDVLPGLFYMRPPSHGQLPYDALDEGVLSEKLAGESGLLHRAVSKTISGLSPKTARELALRAAGSEDAVIEQANAAIVAKKLVMLLLSLPDNPSPALIKSPDGDYVDFCAFHYGSYTGLEVLPFKNLSSAMDVFYTSRDLKDRVRQKSSALHRVLKNNVERCEKKLALQFEALQGSERMEEYRLKGDLLTASLYLIKKGAAWAEIPNYYDPEMRALRIELLPQLSPGQNAQRYFKLYQKARSAQKLAKEQCERTAEELQYLEGQLDNLSKCTEESEIAEIRDELEKIGYVRPNHNRRTKKALPPSMPLKFTSRGNLDIFVGKNNVQNDKLTFSARSTDTWLHAKDIPGSHVLIPSSNPDKQTIEDAATLAAYYSKARTSSNVPVDITQKKYVKKPGGTRPGFVIYSNQTTVFVTPTEEAVKALGKGEEIAYETDRI